MCKSFCFSWDVMFTKVQVDICFEKGAQKGVVPRISS